MNVAYDLSVMRHPPAGTARYATELLTAMQQQAEADRLIVLRGWPRLRRGGPLRRMANLTSDLIWLTAGAWASLARDRADAWLSPANVLPFGIRRPMVVSILDSTVTSGRGHHDVGYARYAAAMFRSAGRRAARVLTISEDAKRRIADAFSIDLDRIVVGYPGVDHVFRAPPEPRPTAFPQRYALFVSQTEPHKNVPRLIDAWAMGVPDGLDLVIAGAPGRDEPAIQAAIERSPAPRRIHRLGRVAERLLARLYDDAECFIFPSLAEGFGMPPIEAMARGVPTAVSDLPVLREVTDGGALLFDAMDAAAIADAVRRLAESDELRTGLAAKGRLVTGRYRWSRTAEVAWTAVREAGRD